MLLHPCMPSKPLSAAAATPDCGRPRCHPTRAKNHETREVFETGISPQGQRVLAEPINLMEMIKEFP
jgi:hypothetical protein